MLRTYICIFIYKYIYAYTHYPFRYLGRVLSRIPQKETLCRQLVLRHMLNRYSAWIWSQCNTHVYIYMCIRIHTSLLCVFMNTLHYTVYLSTHFTTLCIYQRTPLHCVFIYTLHNYTRLQLRQSDSPAVSLVPLERVWRRLSVPHARAAHLLVPV
jgi:hypothetical protein